MSEEILSTGTEIEGDLREKGKALLLAAGAYFDAFRAAGLRGAVVWLQSYDGDLVILTRGEYRETLMHNIPMLYTETEPFEPRAFGSKLIAVLGGGDWTDASVEHLVLPHSMEVERAVVDYKAWNLRRPLDGVPYLSFAEWLLASGAREATEYEIEQVEEP